MTSERTRVAAVRTEILSPEEIADRAARSVE